MEKINKLKKLISFHKLDGYIIQKMINFWGICRKKYR